MNAPALPLRADQERISGTIRQVVFANRETGYFVARISTRSGEITVQGHAHGEVKADLVLAASGQYISTKYGQQFKTEQVELSPQRTPDGIRNWLRSGVFKGIGTRTADRIVDHFGPDTIDILDADPDRLLSVPGISRKVATRIAEQWRGQTELRDITVFAFSQGITQSQINRALKLYGDEAVAIIKSDPYRLAHDIRGIGFRKADAIARKLGVAFDSPFRIRAALHFALEAAATNGHCALPVPALLKETAFLLDEKTEQGDTLRVEPETIRGLIRPEIDAKKLVADTIGGKWHVFLPELHETEAALAHHIRRLADGETPLKLASDLSAAIDDAQRRAGVVLAPSQRQALETVLTSKLCVITGGPGVGKTTLIRTLLEVIKPLKLDVELCAPTGKAAKRMQESTGSAAQTIHRLLGYTGEVFEHDEDNPLDLKVLISDEWSMPDVHLAHALLRAVPRSAAVYLVGDVDQLPSVGPGRVLADLIGSGAVPVVRLTEIFRQAATSQIVQAAHIINQGRVPELQESAGTTDCVYVELDEPQDILASVRELITRTIPLQWMPGVRPRDIQVLAPMNRTDLGVEALNDILRKDLNPAGQEVLGNFRTGDRIMQVVNDYDRNVFNGDMGYVTGKTTVDGEGGETETVLIADFGAGPVHYPASDLDGLRLAYAITIHKSQGSEFPVVVIPLHTMHYMMLKRNLLYTAVTRGKQLVVIVGTRRAFSAAVRNVDDRQRVTKLREWLTT